MLYTYRVNYEVFLRGRWHPSSCGAMDRDQAERAAADLRATTGGTYRNVKISNDYDRAGRHVALACRPVPVDPEVEALRQWLLADIPATIERMPMTPEDRRERAKTANAALTTEQRQAAGRARAAALHDPETLAARIGKAWPDMTDEKRRAVRRKLREAGVIS